MKIQTGQDHSSSSIVKLGTSRQVAIPKRLWRELKLRSGEYVEVKKRGKDLVLTPKIFVDKDLEADLAQSFKDFKEGRAYVPFDTAEEMIKSLHENVRRIRAERKKQKRTSR